MTTKTTYPVFGLRRRHVLGGALAMGALASLRWADAATPDAASASFMALSAYLTERQNLDAAIGARLLAAQKAVDSSVPAKLDALWAWVSSQQVPLADLNARVAADKPAFAGLAAQVMQLWYQGIAGSGTNTRVVNYEYALNAQVVGDKLRPPSYAYGGYGSWASNPTTFALKHNPVLQ